MIFDREVKKHNSDKNREVLSPGGIVDPTSMSGDFNDADEPIKNQD